MSLNIPKVRKSHTGVKLVRRENADVKLQHRPQQCLEYLVINVGNGL